MKKVFVSVATYELTRLLGPELSGKVFTKMCIDPLLPRGGSTPACVGIVTNLLEQGRILDFEVELFHLAGTNLPKMRSRAAHAALKSGADVWMMLDDDLYCDESTMLNCLAIVDSKSTIVDDRPVVVALPYLMRGTREESSRVNVQFAEPPNVVYTAGGVPCRRVLRAGCGMMLLNRAALEKVSTAKCAPEFKDEDGIIKPALFETMFDDERRWLGEDLSFCVRLGACRIEIHAPMLGTSVHAGNGLQLSELRGLSSEQ